METHNLVFQKKNNTTHYLLLINKPYSSRVILSMKTKLLLTLACFLCLSTTIFAQPKCGFTEMHQKLMAEDLQYADRINANEKAIQQFISTHPELKQPMARKTGGILSTTIIPVVVHIVHTGGAVGTIYNPSDAQIQGAIDYLNKVFAADATVTSGSNDLGIQFALAKRMPDCSPTTGIVRVNGSGIPNYTAGGVGTGGTPDINVKNLSRWDASQYYNIWIVNKIDGADGTSGTFTAGYAYFPGAGATIDGTVMLATQMVTGAKTLPHELGHAFNLFHVFEGSSDKNTCPANANCSNDGDRVCDTDPISYNQLGGVITFTPRTGPNACNSNIAYGANTENNFMNYTSSYTLFTLGQSNRVTAALALAARSSLATSLGAIPTNQAPLCASQINFELGSSSVTESTTFQDPNNTCRGYTDYTYNLKSGLAPTQAVTATLVTSGTAIRGTDYDITTNGSFTAPSSDIAYTTAGGEVKSFTVRIYDDKSVELQKTIGLSFTLSNNGATIGLINPTHTITLSDNDLVPMAITNGTVDIGSNSFYLSEPQGCFSGRTLTRHRVQYLYRASELNAAGITGTVALTALKLYYYRHANSDTYNGFTVSMSATTSNTLSNYVSPNGFTTVYSGNYTTSPANSSTTTVPFTSNFNWDGTSNIIINICYDNGSTATTSDSLYCYQIPGSTGDIITAFSNVTIASAASGCALPAVALTTVHPRISFDYTVTNGLAVQNAMASQTEYLGPNGKVYFKDASGKIMAYIENQGSFDYGCTQVVVDRAGTSAVPFWNNTPANYVTSKSFRVVPTHNTTTGNYQIKLYYTQAEINGWMAASGQTLANAKLIKVSNGHYIPDVTPGTPYVTDVLSTTLTKNNFGADTIITGTFSNTGFSGFAIGLLPAPVALPANLLSFEGQKNGGNSVLRWTTTNSASYSRFDVETSTNGTNFYKIGSVKGVKNNAPTQLYNFTDYEPANGTNFYRLSLVAADQSFTYSNMVKLAFNQEHQSVTVYPNPVTHALNISLAKAEQNLMIRIVTVDGKVVLNRKVDATGFISVDVSALAKGMYILEATAGDLQEHIRFIKE